MSATATIERLPLRAITPEQERAWRALATDAAEPNPFFEPEMLLPAAERLGDGRETLLVVRSGPRWIACLPVRPVVRWHRLPVPGLASWLHPYCFLGTPLVAADAVTEAAAALRAAARTYLALDLLGLDGPVAAALRSDFGSPASRPVLYRSHERATVRHRADGGYFGGRGKRLREVRRTRRLLEETLGRPVRTVDRTNAADAAERFLRLEASGWKGDGGTALACDPDHRAFFLDVCARFGAAGRLELLELGADGEPPVAAGWTLRAGDERFFCKIAYDETLARVAPGVQLAGDALWRLHERGAGAIDSCAAPDNRMINALWPDRRSVGALLLPATGPSGRLARSTARTLARA